MYFVGLFVYCFSFCLKNQHIFFQTLYLVNFETKKKMVRIFQYFFILFVFFYMEIVTENVKWTFTLKEVQVYDLS